MGNPNEEGSTHCAYNITIYPTATLEEKYITNEPLFFMIGILATFLFTTMFFIAYDCLVQRRHTVVNQTAVESATIVSNLFPTAVRDRMVTYNKDTDKNSKEGMETYLSKTHENTNDVPIADL